MSAALVAARLVQFAAAMVLLGAPLFRLAFGAGFAAEAAACEEIDRWLRRVLIAAAAAALGSALLWLDLEAVIMGDGWAQALDGETIVVVLRETEFGQAWQLHLAFAAGLVVLTLAWRKASRVRDVVVVMLALLLVASLAWAGHAVMRPGASHLAVQVVHLLAGAVWLGSLPPLLYLVVRARQEPPGAWHRILRHVLPRYALPGTVAVGLILATGCLNSLFLVGSVEALVATAYGRVLLVKIGCVLLMIALACVNRFALVPRLVARAGDERATVAALARAVAAEMAMAVIVLAVVSLLGTLPPAMLG